ncbi:MAG: endonuclease/exonuclease/phosphatase family protein [Planctomycetia bacterium]|nr:endonuclease/exonuclease/phosphatase family protein [Planctomycetia bacterium]
MKYFVAFFLFLSLNIYLGLNILYAQQKPESFLRIMTFNIRMSSGDQGTQNSWHHRRKFVVELMQEGKYDFIALQEAVISFRASYDQVKYIKENLPEYDVLYRSREKSVWGGESTPIFYLRDRWELDAEEHGFFWHSDTPFQPGSKSWNTACPRIVTWGRFWEKTKNNAGRFIRTGKSVYILNTHLDHVSAEARAKSVVQIMEFLAKRKGAGVPVFVMGDFNAGENSLPVRYLKGEKVQIQNEEKTSPIPLKDTFRVLHSEETEVGTFHGFRKPGREKIDYIFALPETKIFHGEILRTQKNGQYPSDHFPVTAECVLP